MLKKTQKLFGLLAALPIATVGSSAALISSAHANTTSAVNVAEGHLSVDHLGRPHLNGQLMKFIVKDSATDDSDDPFEVLDVNGICSTKQF
ncbi:hypothetical protein GS501_07420 [Saccharibacter sp. 17.LH.SD]|uniref:hypothetical protein n=1 Tax=Saccharibacter sp. 17.LH.SD TaxID=2689393 RepID=UPI0013681BAD|nr:hypothetical protein [Saccharibacter sp. 17.LH.SD]MXV44867.1 hypothetical protein [Saccharibacter sp. 17.LH.SD]